MAFTRCLNELTSRDWWQIISLVKSSQCLTSKNQFTTASLQMHVQTLVPLWCHHCCRMIYHLANSFSQLLKLEHFPSTNFHPYNLKHRSSAGLIDRFNSASVVIWVSSELGSTYFYHKSYCRHPFLCHPNHHPGSKTDVSGAHNFLLCGTGLKANGKFVCSISIFLNVFPAT